MCCSYFKGRENVYDINEQQLESIILTNKTDGVYRRAWMRREGKIKKNEKDGHQFVTKDKCKGKCEAVEVRGRDVDVCKGKTDTYSICQRPFLTL